jgi:Zn-dependent peptidase ImmA (M78 family)/DNA-binding XRE family transcriptional regulator
MGDRGMAEVVGRRVRELRERMGMTQEQLARKSGIGISTLSEIESARHSPRLATIVALADALGVPLEALLREPASPFETILHAVETPENCGALQQWIERSHRYATVLRLMGKQDISVPHYSASTIEQAEQVAEAERRRLNLGIHPIDDLVGVLEAMGLCVIGADLPETDIDGALFYHPETHQAFALINRGKPPLCQRFTLAHEYGHLLMHRGLPHIDRDVCRSKDQSERLANAFAAAFLMPREGIQQALKAHDLPGRRGAGLPMSAWIWLKRRFKVCPAALAWRLYNLRWIREDELNWVLGEGSQLISKMEHLLLGDIQEPPPIPSYSEKARELALLAWSQEKISDSFVAHILERPFALIQEYLNASRMDARRTKAYWDFINQFINSCHQQGDTADGKEAETMAR